MIMTLRTTKHEEKQNEHTMRIKDSMHLSCETPRVIPDAAPKSVENLSNFCVFLSSLELKLIM